MNPELQKQLADYLAAIASSAKAGSAFVIEQAPLVVQEKIAYGRAVETAMLVVWVVAILFCLRAVRWGYEKEQGNRDDHPGFILVMIFGGIGVVVSAISIISQFQGVAQVWLAPRLYIIEWAASLVSKVAK